MNGVYVVSLGDGACGWKVTYERLVVSANSIRGFYYSSMLFYRLDPSDHLTLLPLPNRVQKGKLQVGKVWDGMG